MTFSGKEIVIKRGEVLTGRFSLSEQLEIKPGTVYDKLQLLKNVNFLNIKSNNRFSIITIINYDSYQYSNIQSPTPNPTTSQQPANNQPTQTTTIITKNNVIKGTTAFHPPTLEEVRTYCKERNSPIDPDLFYSTYESQEWIKANGQPVKNWKATVITWERRDKSQTKDDRMEGF
jgi:hypothetical protein